MTKIIKRPLSVLLAVLMIAGIFAALPLTAYAANNLTIYIMDMLENMDDHEWGYQLYDGDVSIAEGTYVQINMGTWHTGVMNIYMNGEVVYTKPSGSLYKDDVYHFTAGPNCKILGGYQNMFDWDGNPNVYITQDASVAVTGVTLNPNTAQTIDVGGSVAFTATVKPDDATDRKVKWSATGGVTLYTDQDCTEGNEVGTDATDTLTVYAKGISAGSATVTCTSNADSEKKASCDVTVNAAQTQTEELLTTITGAGSNAITATSANVSYSTEGVATLTFSGVVSYQSSPAWGWWGYGWTATVTPADGYTITKCVFYDDANRTATDSEAPFVVETTEEEKTPQVNGTPMAYTSKGIKKIEVYGYATPTTYTVTWKNGDTTLKTDTVDKDAIPAYNGATPTKDFDGKYYYDFKGWTPEITAVTGNATYTAVFEKADINYGDDNKISQDGTVDVSAADEGAKKFGLNSQTYLNMQMLGVQKKSAIATAEGDNGIRFVTAVNTNLLKGSKIDDYGYIVVKAKAGTDTTKIYDKMNNLTYGAVDENVNVFSCKGKSNTISGDFGLYDADTDYKYITLAITGTDGVDATLAARFYIKTTDGKFYYADYIDGNNATHGGMAFDIASVVNNLV